MRLLNIYTLKFQEFFEAEIPSYHILSHRWSRNESSYVDFCNHENLESAGYRKIIDFCAFIEQRRQDGFISRLKVQDDGAGLAVSKLNVQDDMSEIAAQGFTSVGREDRSKNRLGGGEWVWIDTCCIDKRSSAEVTEAINSMFRWYANSYECIVHLNDVHSWARYGMRRPYRQSDTNTANPLTPEEVRRRLGPALSDLIRSVWFERGWTLQELLAPNMVVFCNEDWEVLGHICKTKTCSRNMYAYGLHLNNLISYPTHIPARFFDGDPLYGASIAQRMSWASHRKTTRLEDEAYCLLGIFNVNLPMVYGEGRKAFRRLQIEIIQQSTDQSIFAWFQGHGYVPILASSPAAFGGSGKIRRVRRSGHNPYSITNNGLQIRARLRALPSDDRRHLLSLACKNHKGRRVYIELAHGRDRYYRYIGNSESEHALKVFEQPLRREEQRLIYIDTGVEDTIVPGDASEDESSGSDQGEAGESERQ